MPDEDQTEPQGQESEEPKEEWFDEIPFNTGGGMHNAIPDAEEYREGPPPEEERGGVY